MARAGYREAVSYFDEALNCLRAYFSRSRGTMSRRWNFGLICETRYFRLRNSIDSAKIFAWPKHWQNLSVMSVPQTWTCVRLSGPLLYIDG